MRILLVELSSSHTPTSRLAASHALVNGEGIAPNDQVLRATAFTLRQLRSNRVPPLRRMVAADQQGIALLPLVRLGRGPLGAATVAAQLMLAGVVHRRGLAADVVYTLNPHAAVAALPYARFMGTPVVTRLQADLPRGALSAPARTGLRRALRACTGVIAISRFIQQVAEGAGVPGRQIRILPPAIDPAFTRAAPPDRRDPRRFTVGYLGRLHPEKGPLDAVRAFAAAAEPHWRLVIAGAGPLRDEVLACANRLGIRDRLSWLGKLPREELPGVLSELHVVLVPTLVEEGLGRVAVEALLCGAAVVGYDCGGLREAAGPGALLVGRGQVAAMADALRDLAADPRLTAALVRAGRPRAAAVATAAATGTVSAVIADLLAGSDGPESVAVGGEQRR